MDAAQEQVKTPAINQLSASPSEEGCGVVVNPVDETKQGATMLTPPCVESSRTISLYPEQADISRVSEDTPIFSRDNVSTEVVFPFRKPSSPLQVQRDSTITSPNMNSVLERMSSTWVWTKEQLQAVDLSDTLWSTFAGIRNSTLFNAEEEEQDKLLVPVRDPYDSWPYIRTALEQDAEQSREENEGEPSTVWNWALGWVSPKLDAHA